MLAYLPPKEVIFSSFVHDLLQGGLNAALFLIDKIDNFLLRIQECTLCARSPFLQYYQCCCCHQQQLSFFAQEGFLYLTKIAAGSRINKNPLKGRLHEKKGATHFSFLIMTTFQSTSKALKVSELSLLASRGWTIGISILSLSTASVNISLCGT